MPLFEATQVTRPMARGVYLIIAVAIVLPALWWADIARETAGFVVGGLLDVLPIVVPGVVLAAWITASGAGGRVAAVFHGRAVQAVVAATLIGALSPVCGVTVLPLMAGLLAAGVPLAPVMAFWLASPITDPAMLSVTVATLGWPFAIGKTLAAAGLGLFGGGVTSVLARCEWVRSPLRSNRLVGSIGACGVCGDESAAFVAGIWRDSQRRVRFVRECWAIARLMLLVLTPAFAAEFLLNAWLQPNALANYVGRDNAFAVPLAVVVGAPAYLDGYAALPLTRALLDHGMSPGAAMAFLVSGGVISVWGAMAIFPVLRLRPFVLYLVLATTGSMMSGWVFGAFG